MSDEAMTMDSYFSGVMAEGLLRTPAHANRASDAVLRGLGFNLSRGVRKKLAKALPPQLGQDLTRGWRLIHFRHRDIPLHQFAQSVARMSGNTDPQNAELTIAAVFKELKRLIDDDLVREVGRDLSPELRALWSRA